MSLHMKTEIKLVNGKVIRIRRATPAQQNNAETRSLRHAAKVAGETAVAQAFSRSLPHYHRSKR